MSAQQLTFGGRPPPAKERYVPLRERAQDKPVPLYDRPEAQPYLMTVESMLERSTGTLQDSIWAPQNRVRQASQQRPGITQAYQPVRQPSGPTQLQKHQQTTGPTQEASPAVQVGAIESEPWSNSAWGTEAPKSSTVGQGNSSWEGQPSQPAISSGEGAASKWAVQPLRTVNPEPARMASTSVTAGRQVPAVASSQLRTVPRQSFVPFHLQGIQDQKEQRSGGQAPLVAAVVTTTAANPVVAQQAPMFQNTDEEAWARKMGLIREPTSEKQPPNAQPTSMPQPTTQAQPDPVALTTKVDTEEESWARKMGFLPKVVEQKISPSKGDTEAEEWAQKMGLLHKPAPKKQVSGALQSPARKPQHGLQPSSIGKPSATTQNTASKVGQNAPFKNPQFHLNQNSNENFQQYIQGSTVTNGKKYTFNGLAPAAQHDASVGNDAIEQSGRSNLAVQQQSKIFYQQQGPPHASVFGQKPVQAITESRALFTQNDSNMMFSPNKMASTALNVNKNVPPRESTVSSNGIKGPWPTLQPADVKSFNQKVTHELNATKQVTGNPVPLTQGALAVNTGFTPRNHSHNFEDQVSDDGVVELNVKEGIRANQENNGVDQLADWDRKRFAPAPADWENDRPEFDASFVPRYIQEWRQTNPCGPSIQVDTTEEKFKSGKCPINNDVLIDPIEQPESMPDISNCENEVKRLHQTALLDANNFQAREEKKQRKAESIRAANEARHRQIALAVDEPNPFSPKIEMYVRPAQQKDAQDIKKIYNHYVNSSIIPEDQEPISLDDAEALIETAQREKLPFVVAVKGRVPTTRDAQGRARANKIILPQVETVLGFAFAERLNYSFSGTSKGRSRGTVTIQLYVDHTSTRKGVGRNTLDQLLHCMATAYTFKNACAWVNPDNDPVHEPNGCGLIHQMIMMVPVLKVDDLDFPWLSKFLYNKFWFKEENRLKSVARSSTRQGTGRMLDIAILQCELLHEGEFDAFS